MISSTDSPGPDVLIASAPHADTFGYSMPPPGLLRLGGALLRHGIAVRLDDLAYRQASGELPADDGLARTAAQRLLSGATPDVIGLSVMGATLPIALAILREVRCRAPHARLLLGGPGIGGVDVAVLERFAWVDAIVRGEAEETLPELIGRIRTASTFDGVTGTTWRDARGSVVREANRPAIRDLATLPAYAWELLPPLADYKAITGESEGLTPVDSGRGCVYDCSFCSIGRYWSRRSRPLPAARLADEVAAIRTMPGARHAYLCHDLFGADRSHALAFCDELSRRDAEVPWECRARADHLDAELLTAMAHSGCYRVLLGIESASARVRRMNQKGMRDDVDLLRVVDDCARSGIVPILSLILGLPGEEEGALAQTLDFCADATLRAGVNVSLHLANPQPGCALGDEHASNARAIAGIPPDMAWGAGETAPERELIEAHPDLFSTWALLPWREERLRDLRTIADELPEVLMRYPRVFALLRRKRSENTLELYRAWRATGRGFESFARGERDPLVDAALGWEQSIVRACARAIVRAGARGPLEPGDVPRPQGELVHAEYDLAALTSALVANQPLPARGAAQTFLVQGSPSALSGTRTVRLSPDTARLLDHLDHFDGTRTRAALDVAQPGIGRALDQLADMGIVTPSANPQPPAGLQSSP
ncbi:MAG: radical SAM protein [bacterium]|nr:radical SAM protein [bacterium]